MISDVLFEVKQLLKQGKEDYSDAYIYGYTEGDWEEYRMIFEAVDSMQRRVDVVPREDDFPMVTIGELQKVKELDVMIDIVRSIFREANGIALEGYETDHLILSPLSTFLFSRVSYYRSDGHICSYFKMPSGRLLPDNASQIGKCKTVKELQGRCDHYVRKKYRFASEREITAFWSNNLFDMIKNDREHVVDAVRNSFLSDKEKSKVIFDLNRFVKTYSLHKHFLPMAQHVHEIINRVTTI